MEATDLCHTCTAGAGLLSDRCERCGDYSAFQCGPYAMEAFNELSAAGKLALVLVHMAALEDRIRELEDEGQ